jgi:hypothetical protein
MSVFGEPRETLLARLLRDLAYFLFGALLGLFPALMFLAATEPGSPDRHVIWSIPVGFVLGSGFIFCIIGIVSRGRVLAWLLRLLGKEIDPNSTP